MHTHAPFVVAQCAVADTFCVPFCASATAVACCLCMHVSMWWQWRSGGCDALWTTVATAAAMATSDLMILTLVAATVLATFALSMPSMAATFDVTMLLLAAAVGGGGGGGHDAGGNNDGGGGG